MTVSYSAKVATTSGAPCFLKLLLRWRGSIYKLLWRDFAVFAFLYYLFSFIYRFVLSRNAKIWFESIALYCETFGSLIPVAFVLGFYVSLVVSRFWEQYKSIPWPSRMALFVSSLLHGDDERGRLMRRSIMRYLSLSYVLTMSSISPPVKKRFFTMQHMTDAGFMNSNEQKVLEGMKTKFNIYFVPLVWAATLVTRARKEGRIKDDFAVKTLIDEINDYRGKCASLFGYDYVTVPLVYTQVVTIAVYTFFLACLMGRQFLENGQGGDMYFPFFTFLQFLFYMGWLKVAETLLNPFGEDDDDFDINTMIDNNLQSSYLVVDEMHQEHPELLKDQYWDTFAIELPYTHATQHYQKADHHMGSANSIRIPVGGSSQFVISGSLQMPRIPEEAGDEMGVPGEDGEILLSAKSDRKMSGQSGGAAGMSVREESTTKTSREPVNRSTSRQSSVRNFVNNSFSWMSKRFRPEGNDVETGSLTSQKKTKDLVSLRNKYREKDKTHLPSDVHDMMFEMSDDESMTSRRTSAVVVIDDDENKSNDRQRRREPSTKDPPIRSPSTTSNGESSLPTSSKTDVVSSKTDVNSPKTDIVSSKTDLVSSETDVFASKTDVNSLKTNAADGPSRDQAAFVIDLRDQLRELREGKDTTTKDRTSKIVFD